MLTTPAKRSPSNVANKPLLAFKTRCEFVESQNERIDMMSCTAKNMHIRVRDVRNIINSEDIDIC